MPNPKEGPIVSIFNKEPAMILAAIQATLALIIAFGLGLTVEQTGAILAVTAALLGLWTRQSVYSPDTVRKIVDEVTTKE